MQDYFIQFDFWEGKKERLAFNKFLSCITSADLSKTDLIDLCRDLIRDNFPELGEQAISEAVIKVKCFNNIK